MSRRVTKILMCGLVAAFIVGLTGCDEFATKLGDPSVVPKFTLEKTRFGTDPTGCAGKSK